MIALEPLGDRAFLARFPSEQDARDWAEAVRQARPTGVVDVVLAYRDVAVFVEDSFRDFARLEEALRNLQPVASEASSARLHVIPTLYDGEDLPEAARCAGVEGPDVVDLHANRVYTVKAIGFLPGFAYAGDLPAKLAGLPRRERPRPVVPRGSVAIVENQTGIYPANSPGGWHLLGRTPLKIVDVETGHFPIRAGDQLRFVPIEFREYQRRLGECLE